MHAIANTSFDEFGRNVDAAAQPRSTPTKRDFDAADSLGLIGSALVDALFFALIASVVGGSIMFVPLAIKIGAVGASLLALTPGAPIIFALFCLRSLPSALATGVMACLIGHAVRSTLIFMVLSAMIAAVVGLVFDRIVYENDQGMIVFSVFSGIDFIAATVAALFWHVRRKRAAPTRSSNAATWLPTGTERPAFAG